MTYPKAEQILASTHKVENQPPILENYNQYLQDQALVEAVKREGAAWAEPSLIDFGATTGSQEKITWGKQANNNKPTFASHNHYGERIDEVNFHPAYHQFMSDSKAQQIHALPWLENKAGANVKRAALYYLQTQAEAGHLCPITMTHACIATLRKQPSLAKEWQDKILNPVYDPRNIPHSEKNGLTIGMAMTEKQGGSDVRTNSTKAYPIGKSGAGECYELVGHKYFVSAPMSDGFLMLAQTQGGISCFLVPRWRPDGSKNPLQLTQLKDKMGNVSNASSETELRGAFGWLIGEEGRGIANILEMVALTRFDCMIGSAAGMRQAVTQITHHCHYRKAFGKTLSQQPLMQNVLADLNLEAEAALAFSMRIARAQDSAQNSAQNLAQSSTQNSAKADPTAASLVRLSTAIGKYWICKRTPAHAYESMECIGGSGVMENSMMPRLYRDAPINTIWEGSGNVQCLDVLRAINKDPESLDAVFSLVNQARGEHALLDQAINALPEMFVDKATLEYRARAITEHLALTMQAAILVQNGNALISDAFIQARFGNTNGHVYGTLATGIDCQAIIERARVKL
ncbi:MAG: DNA alkylation response protein [Gammaproteobacteria bacterium]|nr:MAG: DNA alkylation response protein [Gammaproteobacteria bacterium]